MDDKFVGHYVPQLSELVYDRNKNTNKYPYIKFKGFIVGNPEISDEFDKKGALDFAWGHAIISDENYYVAKKSCDFSNDDWSDTCYDAIIMMWEQYKDMDIYNGNLFGRLSASYDPCSLVSLYTRKYFNRKDVQKALHVNGPHVKWQECNYTMSGTTYNRSIFSVLPIYKKLINVGLKIWMYSGDVDARVPFLGTRYCVENLNLTLKSNWTNWYCDHQVAGKMVEYEGLTYLTVKGAGHSVPSDKPNESRALIHSYLTGQPLQTHK
ncbi:serine carboxypeptidase-like 33 [Striga asiatica]|uniref:Serine carboxypeptidase-like 33 n=1 Tax=Striga asiatica TaxID=4170 RepID=A0A5A7PFV9_STRAF|nr:serine carboxypeptidase-like 33 [Striga asiatica]